VAMQRMGQDVPKADVLNQYPSKYSWVLLSRYDLAMARQTQSDLQA